jgi:hypothetical protein
MLRNLLVLIKQRWGIERVQLFISDILEKPIFIFGKRRYLPVAI